MPNTPEKAMTDEIRNKPLMWSYQQSFRVYAGIIINAVMKELGVPEAGAEGLLVGVRFSSQPNMNDVCVEPEEGKWSISLFEGLLEAIEAEFASHPMQRMFYTDRTSMEEKPENIRRGLRMQGRAEGTGLRTDRTGLPAGAVASFSPAARTATGNVSNRSSDSSRPRGKWGCRERKAQIHMGQVPRVSVQGRSFIFTSDDSAPQCMGAALAVPVPQTIVCAPPE